MTLLEFWGAALITFGPALAMFILTIAHDPIKVILLISACFFWLMSFLVVAICWSIISTFCDYLIIGAFIAVISQEMFRYLFYFVTRKAEEYFDRMMKRSISSSRSIDSRDLTSGPSTSTAANVIQLNNSNTLIGIHKRIPVSYGKFSLAKLRPLQSKELLLTIIFATSCRLRFWSNERGILYYECSYRLHWSRNCWNQGRLKLLLVGFIINSLSFPASKCCLVHTHVREHRKIGQTIVCSCLSNSLHCNNHNLPQQASAPDNIPDDRLHLDHLLWGRGLPSCWFRH